MGKLASFTALLSAALLLAPAAQAQQTDITKLPPGQALLNISATEREEVQQDLLVANLSYGTEGADARAVQAEINELMARALQKAKSVPGIEVSTDQYYVYPYDPNPEPVPANGEKSKERKQVWRGSQGLSLEGKAAGDILKLAGELQDMGLAMNGLSYTLSTAKMDSVRDSLMEKTLASVKARAERAAKALGKSGSELVEITVDAAYPDVAPQMMMRGMAGMASSKMDAPVAEPGKSEISLTVTARVLLKP